MLADGIYIELLALGFRDNRPAFGVDTDQVRRELLGFLPLTLQGGINQVTPD